MKNFVQPGDTLDLVAPTGGVTSGVGVLMGAIFVVACITAAEGAPFTGARKGIFDHAAATHATDQAWTVGDILYWDATNKVLTKTATGNIPVAVAAADKVSTVATGRALLVPRLVPKSAAVAAPTGGTTTDAEARAAVTAIIAALVKAGILSAT